MKKLIIAITMALLFVFALTAVACAVDIKRFETDEFQSGDNITYLEGINTDAYLDDTGRNQDLSTLVDNEKYFSRVVIKNSDDTYTTYPAWYVVNLKYDWQGSYQYSTVERLNAFSEQTGETYTVEDIVRFEYPEFIESAKARKGTGTPGSFPNAKYIRIPSHFTGISFFNGYNVEIIEFAPTANITTIGKAALLNCYSLKEIILPNTVTKIEGEGINFYTQQSTSQLKLLNLGASVTTLGAKNAIRNCTIPGIRVVCPDTIDGSVYNYEYFPSTAVVLFTGSKENAEKFGFTYIMSYDEYLAAGEEAEPRTIVYGYSPCLAFYGGEHIEKDGEYVFEDEKYTSNYCYVEGCGREGCNVIEKEIICAPLFEKKGYSYSQNDASTFSYTVYVNVDAIKAYNPELLYGIVVSASVSGAPISYIDGVLSHDDKTVMLEFQNSEVAYSIITAKLTGVGEGAQLHLSAYCVDKGAVSYVGHNEISDICETISHEILVTKYPNGKEE